MAEGARVRQEGDTFIIRASAIGYCIKALVAEKMGIEKASVSEKMQKAFDAGHKYEREIIETVYRDKFAGMYFLSDRERHVILRLKRGLEIHGHMDYLLPDTEFWEVKLLAESEYKRVASKGIEWLRGHQTYAWQNSAYMHATKLPCLFIVGEKVDGEWTGKYTAFRVDTPLVSRKDLLEKALAVRNWDTLPACDRQMFPCQYLFLHTEDDEVGSDQWLDLEEDRETLDEYARKLANIKATIETLNKEKELVYQGIHALVDVNGATKLRGGEYKVTWIKTNRFNIDWEAMDEETKERVEGFKTKLSVSQWPKFTKVTKKESAEE